MQNACQSILEAILKSREASSKPLFTVAIDGRCASGKTTIATALAKELNATLIHMDDFFLRPEQRTAARLAFPGENIDHERFLEEVLLPLQAGEPFSYRPYSCATGSLGEPILVQPKPIILIEGSYAHHPSLRPYYDLCVFVTVPPEEQLKRITKRNGDQMAKLFRERWIPMEELYFSTLKIAENAQLIINNQ